MHFEWWETGPINIRGLIAWSMYMVRLVSDIVHLLCLGGVRLGHCASSDMVIVLCLEVSDMSILLCLDGVRLGHCILFGWCQI